METAGKMIDLGFWMIIGKEEYPAIGKRYDLLLKNGTIIYNAMYDESDDYVWFEEYDLEYSLEEVQYIRCKS